MFDGEIKTISLYFFNSLKLFLLIGPITIFISWDFKSSIDSINFLSSLKPESLGTIKTFSSFISSSANWREYKIELPNSLYSPDNGASSPIFKIWLCSLAKRLVLKKNIM